MSDGDASGTIGGGIVASPYWSDGEAPRNSRAGTSSLPDVQLVLGTDFTWNFDPNNRGAANGYDAIGAIEHEISEGGFGRVGGLGYQNHAWGPMDLFRYSSPGHRDYTAVRTAWRPFSRSMAPTSSLATIAPSAPPGSSTTKIRQIGDIGGDSFGFGGKGVVGVLSSVDLRVLDILGWAPTGAAPAATDDFRNSLTDTTHPFGLVAVGNTSTGNLEVVGDRDWFQVQVNAGTSYQITVLGQQGGGGTLEDSYLRVHNSSGALVGENDDTTLGTNRDSQLTFTPGATGTYYLNVGAFNDGYAGTYRVAVAVAAPADDFKDSPADAGVFGSVAVNGSASGNLEINGDRDWFQVQLLAGASYVLALQGSQGGGGTLEDPYLSHNSTPLAETMTSRSRDSMTATTAPTGFR